MLQIKESSHIADILIPTALRYMMFENIYL